MKKGKCKFCGKDSHGLIYCNECRPLAVKAAELERIRKGEKYTDSIEETLAYCQRLGISYGEYQKLISLNRMYKNEEK